MAQWGRLAGALVLNDLHLANRLRATGCEWVVVREYDLEYMPQLEGNASDIARGYEKWDGIRGRYLMAGMDKRIYVQPHNELNHPADGYYYRGLCEAAHADGFRLAIFADSHGNPAGDTFEPAWRLRVSSGCLAEAKRGGSIYNYHAYGALHGGKESSDPGSAIWYDEAGREVRRDDVAWQFYGGRHQMAYAQFVPPDQRIPIIFGEAGPSDAIYRGPQQVIGDLRGFHERLKADNYVKAIMYWSVGQQPPWQASDFGTALPAINEWLSALQRA